MQIRIPLLVMASALALVGSAGSASAIEDCFFLNVWRADNYGNGACPDGQPKYRLAASLVYECKWGAARQFDLGPPNFEGAPEGCRIPFNLAKGYVDHSDECGPSASYIREISSACDGELALPADCGNDATRDKSGCVGDPVNLRTGALSLDPVDIDLGEGLRFARHYASNALVKNPPSSATLPGIGYKWSHSLYWDVKRIVPTAGIPVIIVTEPMRSPVPYLFDGTSYEPVEGDGGSVTVDPDLDVHFTNADGVQADFNYNTADQKYYLTQILHPGELPILVTPGPASTETTFARGSRAIVIRRSSTPNRLSRVTEYHNGSAVPGQQ